MSKHSGGVDLKGWISKRAKLDQSTSGGGGGGGGGGSGDGGGGRPNNPYLSEDRGMRIFSKGVEHNHLTDGITFQPNPPYVCGTDVNLLKWKYLDLHQRQRNQQG